MINCPVGKWVCSTKGGRLNVELILMRHGESRRNKEQHKFVGGGDSPLTENGVAQVREVALMMRAVGYEPDEIWSSLLRRAQESAREICRVLGVESGHTLIHQDRRLNELHAGLFEGRRKDEVLTEEVLSQMRALGARYSYPGGQSLEKLAEQVVDGWMNDQLPRWRPHERRRVLVVTHGHVIRAVRMRLFCVHPLKARALADAENASLTRIDLTNRGPVEVYVNRVLGLL